MDLIATLRRKIEVLDDGDYIPGLKAVLLHVETAFRHLTRGQKSGDDTAFTDAIYRTNQAFEGSIKEAYRVLASQDPDRKRPFDIQNYLEEQNVFRSRVLRQLTTYRTEWRNPSAHDHKLDFDESESFLAIVSVSAFACLLLDQIAERLAFNKAQAEAEAQKATLSANLAGAQKTDLLSRISDLLAQFSSSHAPQTGPSGRETEVQVIGALHGYLASIAPDLSVQTGTKLVPDRPFRADFIIAKGNDRVVIELKRRMVRHNFQAAIAQVEHYLLVSGVKGGVLLFLPEQAGEVERMEVPVTNINTTAQD